MHIAELLKKIAMENVIFSKHAAEILEERKLSNEFIIEKLFDLESLKAEAKQNGTTILIYSHTSKYHIVIVVSAENNSIKIVTAFKSSKRIEKLLKSAKAIISYSKIIPSGENNR